MGLIGDGEMGLMDGGMGLIVEENGWDWAGLNGCDCGRGMGTLIRASRRMAALLDIACVPRSHSQCSSIQSPFLLPTHFTRSLS